MNDRPAVEPERFCSQCGAEHLGEFCWRCGAPALGAVASPDATAGIPPPPRYGTAATWRPPAYQGALDAVAAYRRNPVVARAAAAAAAAVVTVASIALPPVSLLLGLATFVVLALALRADAERARATAPDRA